MVPVSLSASSFPMYPLKVHHKSADKIILGKVKSYGSVAGVMGGNVAVCGWSLEIEIEHAFRGSNETITIFTDEFDNFIGVEERYFMLLFKNDTYELSNDDRLSKCDYKYSGMMESPDTKIGSVDLTEFQYTTRHADQNYINNLFPVDPYLTKKLGGDWLMNGGGLDNLSTHIVENDENPDHPESYLGVYFLDFLKDNWEMIKLRKN